MMGVVGGWLYRWVRGCAMALACIASGAFAASGAQPCASPLTVFSAERILTMEPAFPEAGVVAVQGQRIVAVGRDLDDLAAWTGHCEFTVDDRFSDAVLMPGFIDPHLHPMLAAVLLPSVFITPDPWTLPTGHVEGVTTPRAYRERLLAALDATDPSEPFVTWGWHERWHGPLNRAALDALAPDRPVFVWQRSFHEIITNSAGIEMLGFDRAAEEPPSLPDVVDPAHVRLGEGHFLETGLLLAVGGLGPVIQAPERIQHGLRLARQMAHAGGITTMADMALGLYGPAEDEAALLHAMYDNDETPFRMLLVPHLTPLRAAAGPDGRPVDQARRLAERFSGERVFMGDHVKFLADGAFYSQLMQMGPPGYADGHSGEWLTPPEVLRAEMRDFWMEGFTLHVHANGDAGVAVVLDEVERLLAERNRPDHRTSIEHFGYSTEDQNRRLARLGLVVSAQPWYVHVLSDLYGRSGMGWDRAQQLVRLGSLERKQVPVALHSDLTMAPSQPLLLAWAAATRRDLEGSVAGANERLSLDAALRAITIDAAFVLRMDDEIGSIRAGKRADFTVLDRDPREAGAEGLPEVRVLATVFEGQVHPVEPWPEGGGQ